MKKLYALTCSCSNLAEHPAVLPCNFITSRKAHAAP